MHIQFIPGREKDLKGTIVNRAVPSLKCLLKLRLESLKQTHFLFL